MLEGLTRYEHGGRSDCATVGGDQRWSITLVALCEIEVFGVEGTLGCLRASELSG